MNSREHQTINIVNMILAFTLVTLFIKVFAWSWRKSKVGTILAIAIGPYFLIYGPHLFTKIEPVVLCEEHPHQAGCVKLWEHEPYIPRKDRIKNAQ